ncbi:MAG: hypothetical protein ABIT38_09645 [Gemmatimonadaceae bacterium]
MKQPTLRALWFAFVSLLPACTTEREASRQEMALAAPELVALSITGHTIQAPDTIDGGWITFHFANHGDDIHYAHIVRLDSGRTVSDLVAAYAEAIRTSGARPKWVIRFGGPGGAAPGDSSAVTEYLEDGSYVWICPVEDRGGNPHFGKGEFKSFVVRAGSTDAAARGSAPIATRSIRLTDFGFAFEAPLMAGPHTIRVENTGMEPHDLGMLKLVPGKTAEDVRMSLNPERARRPDQKDQPEVPLESLGTGVGGIAAIRPGMEVFFRTNLTPGEYVLFCMATAPDGRSHIEHGMIQQVRIE